MLLNTFYFSHPTGITINVGLDRLTNCVRECASSLRNDQYKCLHASVAPITKHIPKSFMKIAKYSNIKWEHKYKDTENDKLTETD